MNVIKLIELALEEDLGALGDITSHYFVSPTAMATGQFKAKEEGIIAGLEITEAICERIDPSIQRRRMRSEGERISPGEVILEWEGNARSILTAERTALNFLQRLSGVATKTRAFVSEVKHTNCQVLDTRKTTPGWRLLEKEAVRAGGGQNHRMGLYDRAMIKDNHLVSEHHLETLQLGIQALNKDHPTVEVQLEADTLDQVQQFLTLKGVDYLLLDNMTLGELRQAVNLRSQQDSSIKLEASGGITLETVKSVAETGVDFVSVGALTHSAVALDISLDFIPRLKG